MNKDQPERFMIMDACVLIDYLTAKRQGMICITNDKNLRKQCSTSDVPILWGLELILELVRAIGLSKEEASLIAIEIHKSNPKHINQMVLDGFQVKLKNM